MQELAKDTKLLGNLENSLSALQLEIWRTLMEWWNGAYHDADFKNDIPRWRKMVEAENISPKRSAFGPSGQRSYLWCMFSLPFQEVISDTFLHLLRWGYRH
jgi:hypothetical protein